MSKENESQEETTEVEIDDSALLEAMDEAIVEVSPHLEEESDDGTDDDTGTDESGSEESEGSDDSNEADEGDNADGDAADAGDGEGDSDSDKGDGDGSGEGEGDGVSESDAEAAAAAAEPDHINDPIPEGTKEQTAARITGLIDIAKEQTRRADQGTQIIDAITGVGADPEQFNNTLGFLELYNSTDPKSRKQALEVARGVVHELSVELGEGSADLLARHDDLQAEVEEKTLTEARAIEIATQREARVIQNSRSEHTAEQDAQTKETNRLIVVGKEQLTAYENTVKTDPAYEVLYPTFRGILATTLRTVHPDKWGETAKSVYENLKANYTPAALKPTPKPGKTPLRAKQTAGGGSEKSAEPKSGVEAVSAALEGM